MTLTLRYAARSDRGLIRAGNQDSVYAGPRLLAVADGMGGMAAGDVASNIVIATMAPLDDDAPGGALIDALRATVEAANQQIRDAVDANPAMEGMGTTLTAMLFTGSKIGMVHIGDSRAYLLRDGEFAQITKDDTYVQMLIDEGRISAEEADTHPQRHLLYRALDGRDAEPEYSVREARAGDRYLLCSDGLSGVVSQETIANTLREFADPNQCSERLVQLALRGGGPDNITVIIADVTDGDIAEESPIVGGAAARDRGMATSADDSMSSARASALNPPRPAAPEASAGDSSGAGNGRSEEDGDRRRRHPVRSLVVVVLLLALLGGGVWILWGYTQSRFYVGATNDGAVAIFRGVPGQIAGMHLSSVHMRSDVKVTELTDVAQEAVKQGIPAKDESEARRKLDELTRGNLKACQPSATANASDPAPSPSGSPTLSPGSSQTPAATTPTPPPSGSASGSPSVEPTMAPGHLPPSHCRTP